MCLPLHWKIQPKPFQSSTSCQKNLFIYHNFRKLSKTFCLGGQFYLKIRLLNLRHYAAHGHLLQWISIIFCIPRCKVIVIVSYHQRSTFPGTRTQAIKALTSLVMVRHKAQATKIFNKQNVYFKKGKALGSLARLFCLVKIFLKLLLRSWWRVMQNQ